MEKVFHKTKDLDQKVGALVQLGAIMHALGNVEAWPGHSCGLTQEEYLELDEAIRRARQYNGWAIEDNVRFAFRSWGELLQRPLLDRWLSGYADLHAPKAPLRVGTILAGNVPLVGLHDVISIWLSGHRAQIKPSSQEPELIPALIRVLDKLVPGTAGTLVIAEGKLGEVDAVIATGSNNTARYFDHYFGHLPRIVRKNRVSVAVFDGSETKEEISALGEDIFRYFGLGCRNVSKLFIPEDLELDRIFEGLYPHSEVIQHHKYVNNYDYTRALWLLDGVSFLENGFVLLKEDTALASPVSAIFYERYSSMGALQEKLAGVRDSVQCIVGHGYVPFGMAQQPDLADHADGVDTLKFLLELDQGQYS